MRDCVERKSATRPAGPGLVISIISIIFKTPLRHTLGDGVTEAWQTGQVLGRLVGDSRSPGGAVGVLVGRMWLVLVCIVSPSQHRSSLPQVPSPSSRRESG